MLIIAKQNLGLSVFAPIENEGLRAIAYSMDLLILGVYLWLPGMNIRIGGSIPDDLPYRYPGKIHSLIGIALVFRGRIFTTYQGSFDESRIISRP